jgi:hypothetical protein
MEEADYAAKGSIARHGGKEAKAQSTCHITVQEDVLKAA